MNRKNEEENENENKNENLKTKFASESDFGLSGQHREKEKMEKITNVERLMNSDLEKCRSKCCFGIKI